MFIIEPIPPLKSVVKQFWYTNIQASNGQGIKCKILADGAPGIIFQHEQGHSAVVNKTSIHLPVAFAYGQSTQPCLNEIIGRPFIFGVNFRPNAFKTLFSLDASELTNDIVDIEHLLGAEFCERLLEAASPQEVIQLFSKQFLQKALEQKQQMIVASIHLILQKTPEIDPKMLASHFHISRRQFQRKFKACIGVCPEMYIRIVKFQKSLHLISQGQYCKLSDIGYALNYADQSHFNREFKLFAGDTPKQFEKTKKLEQPFVQSNTALRIVRY
ncbi:hypothetical protein BKI52_01850 [marine bacterium AO1-C]|nr:hypothetical protein BKI52_01850 [marine bacterium AO1-C]